ncbi:glycine betaine/L-proline ABC transporter ATP-binding protein [Roseovarius sp. CAU 1744]|uniref:quaternary amine ABC transporter ATP-binding protein n=1 Tax=Roseovarius sp. CAU 1744 TaxID=3140368 RepID=UPI00325A7742
MTLKATGLFKVFGTCPQNALELARGGRHPKDIFRDTGQMVAVSNVDLTVEKGEIFVIMGLSGSGKSTLVRCLNRLIEPTAGTVTVDGEDVTAMNRAGLREFRRTKMAMVFQNFALLPHKTIFENVEFGLHVRGEARDARRDKARSALAQVGLEEWGGHYPHNLSGGMKQRVGLARALASDPDILLMDEPFSALDPLIRADLQDELLQLQKAINKTIIFITHDFQEAVKLGTRIAVMKDGEFVQVGAPLEIVTNSANDYVLNFSRDVDCGKLFVARDLNARRIPLVQEGISPSELRAQMAQTKSGVAVLLTPERTAAGYVTEIDLCAERINGHDSLAHVIHSDIPTVSQETPVSELYAECALRRPVAVTDAEGRVVGAFDASDVLQQLSRAQTTRTIPAPDAGSET